MAVFCSSGVPRKSRPGPMHAQTEPQASLFLSSSRRTCAGSMCDGSSTGISTVSNPHFLNVGNSFVLSLVKGDVNKNVLMPSLINLGLSRGRGYGMPLVCQLLCRHDSSGPCCAMNFGQSGAGTKMYNRVSFGEMPLQCRRV